MRRNEGIMSLLKMYADMLRCPIFLLGIFKLKYKVFLLSIIKLRLMVDRIWNVGVCNQN
mgnify:CR=1 FL=1|jgi:hypothetical protein